MRHLHYQFITASFGLGLGVFLLATTLWFLWISGLPLAAETVRVFTGATVTFITGLILVIFGSQGIRYELYHSARKGSNHAHRH
jgi:hypothetical protein